MILRVLHMRAAHESVPPACNSEAERLVLSDAAGGQAGALRALGEELAGALAAYPCCRQLIGVYRKVGAECNPPPPNAHVLLPPGLRCPSTPWKALCYKRGDGCTARCCACPTRHRCPSCTSTPRASTCRRALLLVLFCMHVWLASWHSPHSNPSLNQMAAAAAAAANSSIPAFLLGRFHAFLGIRREACDACRAHATPEHGRVCALRS